MPPAVDVTFSIATYDRPLLLANTLRCCVTQANRRGLALEVLVTDNHPSGNGIQAVQAVQPETTVPIRYQAEPTRNMSVLRNAGLKAARGRFIVIIDDDEFCGPDWLDALLDARDRTDADVVFGPRTAIFAAGHPPPYDPHARMFTRDLHLPNDTVVALVAPDGRPRYGMGTGNTLLTAATCCAEAEPFDRAFGNAGGEDSEYFMHLYCLGRRLVWTTQAVVTEIVPEHRTAVPYRLLRARRETQIYASIHLHHAHAKARVRLTMVAKGLVQLVAGTLLATLTNEWGSATRLRFRLMRTVGRAKLEYRRAVGYIEEPSIAAMPSTGA